MATTRKSAEQKIAEAKQYALEQCNAGNLSTEFYNIYISYGLVKLETRVRSMMYEVMADYARLSSVCGQGVPVPSLDSMMSDFSKYQKVLITLKNYDRGFISKFPAPDELDSCLADMAASGGFTPPRAGR